MAPVELDLEAAATLVVVWRSGRYAHGRAVRAGGEVTNQLRLFARRALERVARGELLAYDPNDEQADDSYCLEADRGELLDTALLEQVMRASALQLVSPDELRRRRLALYALVIGNDPDRQTAFIRKGNAVSLATKSMVAVFDDGLRKVEEPILAFDERYDMIVYPGMVHILNQRNFEALFRESDAVLAKVGEWVKGLRKSLPMSQESADWLTARLRKNSVMRRRVRSVLASDYFPTLTVEVLREKIIEQGWNVGRLMDESGLIVTSETENDIIPLLNEDLWVGAFSGNRYSATRKARR